MGSSISSTRLGDIFSDVLKLAVKVVPELTRVTPGYCKLADQYHDEEWRCFAHSIHRPWKVCWARAAADDLTDGEIIGISAHELGHIIAEGTGMIRDPLVAHSKAIVGERTPQAVQNEANWVVKNLLKLPLRYNKRELEEVSPGKFYRIIRGL